MSDLRRELQKVDKKKFIAIRVTEDEHQMIKEEALRRRTSMTKLILQALVYYTERFNR